MHTFRFGSFHSEFHKQKCNNLWFHGTAFTLTKHILVSKII